MALPSDKEEVWRYSPIDALDLDGYAPVRPVPPGTSPDPLAAAFVAGVARDLPERAATVTTSGGAVTSVARHGLDEGVLVGSLADAGEGTLGRVLAGGDALVRLNDGFHPDAVVIDVPDGAVVADPIVVVHWCDAATAGGSGAAPASFPRTVVRIGRGASAGVVEVVAGPPQGRALVVPVTELHAEDGAVLSYVGLQVLGPNVWHIARIAAASERDASLRTFTVGLGGAYDRSRTDAVAAGAGSTTQLRSAYLGTGEQVHDVRTLQDHAAPHTTSDLLCKGAVAGSSRSIYSGLIRVRRGALRTEAFQTNNNLVLDAGAHADSVPNLDIEENDVRCSHASTVGPVDEDQRYYLESRGVPPERAEQLIVLGFFEDIIQRSPVPGSVERLRREVGIRLTEALHIGGGDGDG